MARIIVGMSGGVDSSVAAALLKEQGHEVIGVFMKNWEGDDEEGGPCPAETDWADVRSVCERLDIPYYAVNFSGDYWDRVFSLFLSEYRMGRTPNPDVLCNKEIKFEAFLNLAMELEGEYIATGHFCRTEADEDGRIRLLRGVDAAKDQSYFLYLLNQQQLKRAVFPLGGMTKADVRRLAEQYRLPNSGKKDSTGVCFIGERKFKPFLQRYLPAMPGEMRTPEGRVVGTHDGLMYYTLGQRRGLGIGGSGTGERWFVLAKDLKDNVLIVAQGRDHPLLYSRTCLGIHPSWIRGEPPAARFSCTCKYRYRQPDQRVQVELLDDEKIRVTACETQRAVTPGQSMVFYDGDCCLGGAVCDEVLDAGLKA